MSQSLTLEELKQHRHPLVRNDFDLFIIRYEADIDPDTHRITQLVLSLRSSAGKIRRFRFINPVEHLGQVSANGILESGPIYIVDTRFKGWELMKVEVGIDAEDRDTLFFAQSVEEIP